MIITDNFAYRLFTVKPVKTEQFVDLNRFREDDIKTLKTNIRKFKKTYGECWRERESDRERRDLIIGVKISFDSWSSPGNRDGGRRFRVIKPRGTSSDLGIS